MRWVFQKLPIKCAVQNWRKRRNEMEIKVRNEWEGGERERDTEREIRKSKK